MFSRIIYRALLLICLCLLGMSGYRYRYHLLYYGQRVLDRLEDAAGPSQNHNLSSFGIPLPGPFKVHGIDISHHQHQIDWAEVGKMKIHNDSISFVFIKATEGAYLIDTKFQENWENARAYHMLRGAYHYFKPKSDAEAQANLFCSMVSLQKGDLPPVLDIEDDQGCSEAEIQQKVKQWLEIVESRLRVKPIIYTNNKFYLDYLADDFDDYPLWIAHYYEPEVRVPNGRKWILWQHNDRGKVNGIGGRVDFNVFNGSYQQLCNMCVK